MSPHHGHDRSAETAHLPADVTLPHPGTSREEPAIRHFMSPATAAERWRPATGNATTITAARAGLAAFHGGHAFRPLAAPTRAGAL
jgi:hypothetical protein